MNEENKFNSEDIENFKPSLANEIEVKKNKLYFSVIEWCILIISIIVISVAFFVFDRSNYLAYFASIIGVISLIFNSKGNPIGQVLMIIFGIIYGIISFSFKYYGEMITYCFLTVPMSIFCLISWLVNPYKGKKSEVKINHKLNKIDFVVMPITSILITLIFYFVLKYLNTTNLIVSTISVFTSFIAVYLTFRRSPLFALGYALNDLVLIVLWTLASIKDISYISVLMCFITFFC